MVTLPALDIPEDGRLSHNITHFARALRRAGLPIGPGRVLDAIRAVQAAGFSRKQDFFYVLQACFVSRPEHRAVFAQTFRLYWRDPQFLEHMMSLLVPAVQGLQEERKAAAAEKRAAQALLDDLVPETDAPQQDDSTEVEIDASHTLSAQERLRRLDFEQMSTAEMAAAKRHLATLRLPLAPVPTRRNVSGPGPLADWRRTLQAARRTGGDVVRLHRKSPGARAPALVVLCDISGSMSSYSRAVLHFVHGLANRANTSVGPVHTFTFGTRLTNITRHMARRDVDAALAAAGAQAQDWEGGTRIGACLHRFNKDWSRRVLGQGESVLLITDGLDRDDGPQLDAAMARLARSARQVIWLNPLLRWDDFAPKARGIRTMLPHVTSFRAGHNIASLEGLTAALSDPRNAGDKARMMALLRE